MQSKLEFGQKREQETHRHVEFTFQKKKIQRIHWFFFPRIMSLFFSLDELCPLKIEENKKKKPHNPSIPRKKYWRLRIYSMKAYLRSFSPTALILQMGNQDWERLTAFPKVTGPAGASTSPGLLGTVFSMTEAPTMFSGGFVFCFFLLNHIPKIFPGL